jgi:hypothetical protein
VEPEGNVDLGIDGLTEVVQVARGGFSTVFRARQPLLDRTVAVKVIHATVTDAAGGERFLREVRAAGRLSQHPNVAPIYGAGTIAGGQPYLMMPFYSRGSLAKKIEQDGPYSEAEAVRLGRTLAAAVEYVHQHGVLHRDIKPSNVLLSDVDEPLLCDFGVARLTDTSVSMHTSGMSVVTWAYGPPEAFAGAQPTPAWDVYSLGATLYTMLSGAPPFVDDDDVNIFAVLNRIGSSDVPDLRVRGVSASVADAVRQAMAKSPEDRPSSAAAFADLLAPRPARTPAVEPTPVAERTEAAEPVVEPVASPPAGEPVAEAVAPPPAAPPPAAPLSAEAVVEPERVAGVVEMPHGAEPVAPAERPATPATGTRPVTTPVIVAVVAVVLSFIGASQSVIYGQNWFDRDYVSGAQTWFPMVVLLASVLFIRSAGTAAEWVIGAGSAFVGVSFISGLMAVTYQIVENDAEAGWPSLMLRTAGAIVAVAAVVLAWKTADHEGPPFPRPVQALTVVAAGIIFFSTRRATHAWFDNRWYGTLILIGTVVVLAVLLYRVFRLRSPRNAAPALVAAGLMGAGVWALEIRLAVRDDVGNASVDAWMAIGSVALLLIGLWRWITGRASSPAP